ncbi:MAG: rhamnan synthesis F family protein [Chitinophagaceae bacterium]
MFQSLNYVIKYKRESLVLSDVCLFSSYSFSGKVEEYVYYYLNELQKAGLSIVFVSTSMLTDQCTERLKQYSEIIIERENRCPDFGSWKIALSVLDWGEKLNSVLLANDSVFGPFFELGPIISSMQERYDMWGMTDSYEIDYHLQSYFLYFNKAAISSELFAKFWNDVNLTATKDEVIHKYEIGLSALFRKNNFKLGAYGAIDVITQTAPHAHIVINPTLVFWKSLIKIYKFPFLKRELIIKRHISKTYWNVGLYINVSNWKRTIKENTEYPVQHIINFITNYYNAIRDVDTSIILKRRKILFLTGNASANDEQKVFANFLHWVKKETDLEAEIIVCNEPGGELISTFEKAGIVTTFYTLSEKDKINLKERLVEEIALVFLNSLESLNVLSFFSFLNVPQILFIHKFTHATGEQFRSSNNQNWIINGETEIIADSYSIQSQIHKQVVISESKINVVHKFINPFEASDFRGGANKIKSELELSPADFIIGMYGDLDWSSGADLLAVIAVSLCRNNENVHIVWAGLICKVLFTKLSNPIS